MKPQVVNVILGRSLHFYDCDPWVSFIKVSRNKRGKGEEKAKTIQKKNKKPLRRRLCVAEQKLILYLLHWIWLTKDEGSQKQYQRRSRETALAQKRSWFDGSALLLLHFFVCLQFAICDREFWITLVELGKFHRSKILYKLGKTVCTGKGRCGHWMN